MAISTTSVGIVPSGNNYEVQFNNNGVFGSSTNFTWNGSALGVGVTSPLQTLDVKGVVRAIRSDANYPTDIRSVDIGYEAGNPRISVVRNDATFDTIDIGVSSDGGSNHTSRVFIDATGNVLIGGITSNAGFGASDQQLIVNGATNSRLEFGVGGAQLGGLYADADRMIVYTSSADYLELNTNSVERMRIDSAGRVGIGSAIAGNQDNKLLIRKDNLSSVENLLLLNNGLLDAQTGTGVRINMSGVSEGSSNVRYSYIESAIESAFNDHYIAFGTNDNNATPVERMRIDSIGRVGIGTNSPISYLDVYGDNTDTSMGGVSVLQLNNGDADGDFSTMRFSTGSSGSLAYIGAKAVTTGVYPNAVGQLHFAIQNGAVRYTAMVIDENRYIGIGTEIPTTKIHVSGASTASALRLDETTSSANSYLGYIDTSGNFGLDVNGGGYLRVGLAGKEALRIIQSIGSAQLSLKSNAGNYLINMGGEGSGGAEEYGFIAGYNNGTQTWAISNSGPAYINTGQNFGIGTNNPTRKLDVVSTSGGNFLAARFWNSTSDVTGVKTKMDFPVFNGTSGGFLESVGNSVDGYSFEMGAVQATSVLKFSTGGTERMRILDSGGITFNGDTATANALDDYEEGTYAVTDQSGAGLVFTNINSNRYIKIGKMVWFAIELTFPTTADASNVAISIPFANSTAQRTVVSCVTDRSDVTVQGYISNLTGVGIVESAASPVPVTNASLSGKYVIIGGVYEAL